MIKELFELLTKEQRYTFYRLQALVVVMALFEVFSIASIAPFMALVADPNIINSNNLFAKAYKLSAMNDVKEFVLLSGSLVLLSLIIASLVSMFTTWRLSSFAMRTGTEISDRLFKYYINQNWLFHASGSSAQFTKQITTESVRITNNILQPFMLINSRLLLALFISFGVILYSPGIALSGLFIFVGGYFIIFKIVKKRLMRNGAILSDIAAERFSIINEGLGGIRDVILLNRSRYFSERFSKTGNIQAKAQAINSTLSQAPRYFMELIAFGSMILLVLVLLEFGDNTLKNVLPLLAVYALSGLKILPALQQIYASISTIKASTAAFDNVKRDLIAYNAISKNETGKTSKCEIDINNSKNIYLKNVCFEYPSSCKRVLNNINLKIPLNSTVGFVGESGSGKSTIVDLIVGLIDSSAGQLMIDDVEINVSNKKSWQSNIGFVSQSIFLSEGTIAENIAFGEKISEIDWGRINKSIKLAHLNNLVESLPSGINTKIGERGVQISGGQRQRIGIARALYTDAKVFVFDEATSALDGITERIIMNAVNELKGKRTIIMIAHRLKTIKECDCIFIMDKGEVIDQGTYSELMKRNILFKKMDKYS